MVLLWIIFFPLYLVERRNAPPLAATGPPGGLDAAFAPSTLGTTTPSPQDEHDRRFKTCPDCAETVLAEAKVCKHCHYRFDKSTATSDLS